MNHGGTKPGNWGNGYIIVTPIKYKRVSCASCNNFDPEDGACVCTATIPHVDGYNSWKKCSKFVLSPEYMDSEHKEQVKRIKGEYFFDKPSEKKLMPSQKTRTGSACAEPSDDRNTKEELTKAALEKLYKVDFEIKDIGIDRLVCIENLEQGISAVLIKRFPSRVLTQHDRWLPKCSNLLTKAINYLKNEKYVDQQFVIMPVCNLDEGTTLAELHYKKQGHSFRGIYLVEIDREGKLLIASGPTERYWTPEKIRELKVFKG